MRGSLQVGDRMWGVSAGGGLDVGSLQVRGRPPGLVTGDYVFIVLLLGTFIYNLGHCLSVQSAPRAVVRSSARLGVAGKGAELRIRPRTQVTQRGSRSQGEHKTDPTSAPPRPFQSPETHKWTTGPPSRPDTRTPQERVSDVDRPRKAGGEQSQVGSQPAGGAPGPRRGVPGGPCLSRPPLSAA